MGAESAPNPYTCPWFMGTRGDTIGGVNYEGVVMPYGVFSLTKNRESAASGSTGPSLATRVRMRFRRAELDEALATGVDPGGEADLGLRAGQLDSHAERARIAAALVKAVGKEPMTLLPRPQRAAVRDAADEILSLALRLGDDRPVGVAGVAAAARLVDDRSGPLYRHNTGDLDRAIASAHAALDATPPVATEPAARAA